MIPHASSFGRGVEVLIEYHNIGSKMVLIRARRKSRHYVVSGPDTDPSHFRDRQQPAKGSQQLQENRNN